MTLGSDVVVARGDIDRGASIKAFGPEVIDLAKKRGKLKGRKKENGLEFWEAVNPNEGLKRGKREECLATWYHQATPGTTYWRCVVPARYLPGQAIPVSNKTLAEKRDKFFRKTDEVIFPEVRGDAVIFQFLGDYQRTRLAFGMQSVGGKRLYLEVDDNYLTEAAYQKRSKLIQSTWSATIEEARGGYSNEMHRKLVPHVDGVICATEYLADAYSDFNDNVHVCPNSIDPDDWQYEREEHDTFRIAYYGSTSHLWDTPLVTQALKWASKQPGVEVYLAGFENKSWSFKHQQIPWLPWLDLAREQLFKFDLGIAPLKPNAWANGKSDVKALEYAMGGCMPLLSKEEPYRPWWDKPDFLAEAYGGWDEAIRWAVQNQDAVRELAEYAKDYVLRERSIEQSIQLWRNAVEV